MKKVKKNITPKVLTIGQQQWNTLPFRKYLELLLLQHGGFNIHRGSLPYGRFRPGARKFLGEAIVDLPPCRQRQLILSVLPTLKAPQELSLKFVTLQEKSYELLTDGQISKLIEILSLLFIDDKRIHEIAMMLPLIPNYKLEEFRNYKYWFFNTNTKDDWTVFNKYSFKTILESNQGLEKEYEQLLRLSFGQGSRLQLVSELGLPQRPADRIHGLSQSCDAELAQMQLSQAINDRLGVNSSVRNTEKLIKIMDTLGSPYEVLKQEDRSHGIGLRPRYSDTPSGIGGESF